MGQWNSRYLSYSNPTPNPVSNPLGGSTVWPEFTTDSMELLYFGGEDISVIADYRQKTYAFWTEYVMGLAGEELGKFVHILI